MRIKRALEIGENTSNSLSPIIFNYWFSKYSIKGKYNYLEIKNENFDNEIKTRLKKL